MYYWKWPNSGTGSATDSYTYRYTPNALPAPLATDPAIPVGWGEGILTWSAGTLWLSGAWDDSVFKEAQNITNDSNYQNALQTLYNQLAENWVPLFADFGNTTYQWNLLEDVHSTPDAGGLEAAKLCYHAGMAVNMNYGLDGSSASDSDIPSALNGHFGYDPSATDGGRDVGSIVNEIQWQRPVLIGGRNSSDGHCWVIYGYNQGTSPWQFAMNMGWGGASNGWYSLDTVPLGLTNSQDIVTKVAPQNVVGFVGADVSGNGSPSSPYQNIEEALANAADNTTLILKAGSTITFSSAPLVISRPLTLKGIQATLTN